MQRGAPKFERTTLEQLQYYVSFCKARPELQAGKSSPLAPRTVQNCWNKLAADLNAMRGATRSVAKWKECLSHWKNQLRSRARKAKAELKVTGGGHFTPNVGEFEQQALQTFCNAAVYGLPDIPVLGAQDSTNAELEQADVQDDEIIEFSPDRFSASSSLLEVTSTQPTKNEAIVEETLDQNSTNTSSQQTFNSISSSRYKRPDPDAIYSTQ